MCGKFVYVKLLYVKFRCGRRRAAGGGGEGARDTESKTRTPHKDVGKKTLNFVEVKLSNSLLVTESNCLQKPFLAITQKVNHYRLLFTITSRFPQSYPCCAHDQTLHM